MNRMTKLFDFLTGGEITEMQEAIAFTNAVNDELRLKLEEIGWDKITGEASILDVDSRKRRLINNRALLYWRKDPLVGHAVNLTNWFTFGEGVSTPKVNDGEGNPNVKAQADVDDFWNDADNKKSVFGSQAQWKLSTLLQIEGELFFTLFKDEKGMTVRTLCADDIEDVITHPEDKDTPLFYKRCFMPSVYNFSSHSYSIQTQKYGYHKDYKYDESIEKLTEEGVTAPSESDTLKGDVMHVKINTLGKRGFSEIYRSFDWINAFNTLASARVSHARAEATFAWERKTKGGRGDINAAKQALGQSANPSFRTPPAAGTILHTGEGVDYKLHEPSGGGATAAEKDLRQLRLHIATAFSAPEHYFADGSQGNMATAKTMELWAIKKFLARQKLWEEIYKELVYVYLESKSYDRRELVVDVDFPQIQTQEIFTYLQSLQIAKQNGFLKDDMLATLTLQAFGINNVSDELKTMFAQETLKTIERKAELLIKTIDEAARSLNGAER